MQAPPCPSHSAHLQNVDVVDHIVLHHRAGGVHARQRGPFPRARCHQPPVHSLTHRLVRQFLTCGSGGGRSERCMAVASRRQPNQPPPPPIPGTLESVTPVRGGSLTPGTRHAAAATTGPASGPRPASSTPMTTTLGPCRSHTSASAVRGREGASAADAAPPSSAGVAPARAAGLRGIPASWGGGGGGRDGHRRTANPQHSQSRPIQGCHSMARTSRSIAGVRLWTSDG
jgi:hypothetical protein